MKTTRTIFSIALFCAAFAASGANNFGNVENVKGELPIGAEGSIWIENPIGNIEVVGVDSDVVTFSAQKIVHGADAAAVAEGREQTQILTTGDARLRVFKIVFPALRNARWNSSVNISLQVPRNALLKIASQSSEHIRVANLTRSVTVKNTNGAVILENITGSATVESVNGNIVFDSNSRPAANAQLSTVNGQISVVVPGEAAFRWVAETIAGDFKTNLPVSGRMSGSTFRGGVNALRGPTITTASMMGTVFMTRKGSSMRDIRSVRSLSSVVGVAAGPAVLSKIIQSPLINGDFYYSTPLGSFDIGQVLGSAKIDTGAGEIRLGVVRGECTLVSLGGPLTLNDVFGPINARTKAGDVLVTAARAGGFVSTGGGLIRVLYAGAAMTLHSDGGDIIVRQASAGITADTRSGDITINLDPGVHTAPIDAKTGEGNVTLNVSPRFAAEIDAVIVTSDAESNAIRSDFSGLSIRREQFNGRTRIRATGKVNGGGDRMVLYAEEGDINITAQSLQPLLSPASP
jgi:DUF4097 and DUF4098 domain-containing protein YvlB